jgi:hypothetical protein
LREIATEKQERHALTLVVVDASLLAEAHPHGEPA